MRILHSLALLAVLGVATPAVALQATTLPAGMCAIEGKQPVEQLVLDYLTAANQGGNTLVTAFADCQELAALRQGTRQDIVHYGSILQQQLPGALTMSRQDYLQQASQIYSLNTELITQAISSAQAAAKPAMQNHHLSGANTVQAQSQGVLYNGAEVLVIALAQEHKVGNRTIPVSSIAGVTLLDGSSVSVNLFVPRNDTAGVARARDSLVAYVPTLIRANEP